MIADRNINSRYITHTVCFWGVGRIRITNSGVKGFNWRRWLHYSTATVIIPIQSLHWVHFTASVNTARIDHLRPHMHRYKQFGFKASPMNKWKKLREVSDSRPKTPSLNKRTEGTVHEVCFRSPFSWSCWFADWTHSFHLISAPPMTSCAVVELRFSFSSS